MKSFQCMKSFGLWGHIERECWAFAHWSERYRLGNAGKETVVPVGPLISSLNVCHHADVSRSSLDHSVREEKMK